MEIDFSGLPDKTQPKTPAIDLSGLPDKEINTSVSSGPQWAQGKEPSLIEKTFSFFKDPEKEKSRATLALVDSEVLGISPSAAYRYRDMIDNGLKINQKAAMLQSTKLQRVGQSIDVGKKTNQKGLIGFEALITGDPKWHEEMNRIKLPTEEERFISESRLENAYRQAAEMAPMMLSSALEATPKALTTAALFSAAAGIFLGPETMPAGWGTGMAVGGGIGSFQAAMKREAGLAYSDIINMKDKEGNPINPQIARAASLGIGVINGAIEVAQIKTLLKSIPGFENLLGKAIVETVKSKVLKERLADLAFRYGKNITTETLQELSQESSNIVFEELSKILTNRTKGTQFERAKVEDVFNRLKETATASAQAFAVMFVLGNVAKATAEIAETGKAKEKIKPVIQTSPSVATVTNINRDDTTGEVQSYDLKDNAGNIYDGITPEQVPETIKTILEETQTDESDFETRFNRLIESEDEITEESLSQLLSDEVSDEDMTDVSGVEGKTQQALNEALETEVQPKNSIIDNLSLLNNQKGSIDLEPLVDIGRSVWLEGKQTFEQFYARMKEIAGDLWDKVKDYVKQAWDIISSERGSWSNKPISLYDAVKKAGGIDPEYIKNYHNWSEDIKQYGLVNLTRKGGRALDDLATELQSQGILDLTPDEYAGPGDYLLSELKKESQRKRGLTIDITDLTDEEKAAIKELETEWHDQGLALQDIEERRRTAYEVFQDQGKENRLTKEALEARIEEKLRQLKSVIPTSKVKSVIRRNTGQVSLADFVREDTALQAAFTKAAQNARIAFREGNKAGVEEQKQVIRKILDRRKKVRTIRDYFGLSDDDLKKITRRNPLLMSDQEFHDFLKDVQEEAVYLVEKAQAKFELMLLIESRRYKKWDNYREAMGLPSIHEMNTRQLGDFYNLLEPYEQDDTFLGKREIETVDKTDLAGIRTWREAREKLAQELNVPVQELATVHVGALDSFRWDTALREQNIFYQLLVDDMTKAMMGADMLYHNTESKAYELAKKSEKSQKRSLIEKAIPQDEKIMNFLESPDDIKEMLARDMTPEQLDYAHFMQEYFANALDYLLATKALEKGRENYITHVRKTFLESVKDDGLIQAFKNMWKNYQEDEAVFKILDDDTGKILPLEKFFQFALHRTGYLDPTTNVTKAFLQYARTFERKKMFDAIIPKMDIYAQSLTPETYTATGLETDRTLKKFVYQYVNNKKGRRLSYDGALKQGGKIDVAIRALRTFTSILDLGLSPFVQTATFVGEQVGTAAMLGPVNITKATARIKTEKGRRILKKYEVFTGRSFWEEFTAPGKQITERLTETMFAGFHASMKLANEQFLLGSLTDQEWNSEEISLERLAEMKLEMGRFRPVPETQSLVGSTSVGNAVMQYKTWAVSLTRSIIQDMTTLLSDLKNKGIGEALTTREVKELVRIAGMTSAVLIVGALSEADSDDDSFIGKLKARAYREGMSLTQGMDPTFWLATPRLLTWLFKTAQALKQIVTLEEYKNKPGLKGVENLKKQVVPRTLRLIGNEESQGGRR